MKYKSILLDSSILRSSALLGTAVQYLCNSLIDLRFRTQLLQKLLHPYLAIIPEQIITWIRANQFVSYKISIFLRDSPHQMPKCLPAPFPFDRDTPTLWLSCSRRCDN